jgi:hypothetical protein
MLPTKMLSFALALLLPTSLAACALSGGEDEPVAQKPSATAKQKSALWSCELDAKAVVCTAPLPSSLSDSAAYACQASDATERCPDAGVVTKLEGLAGALAKLDSAKDFEAAPWACLVTGKDQFQCTRSILKRATMTLGAPGSEGGAAAPDGAGSASYDFDSVPPPPSSCAPADWEPFFAKLAAHEYHENGVDIVFPRGIFDTKKSLVEIVTTEGTGAGAGQSCHDGEWSMRRQAWLDAVMAGCLGLNDAILVLCQQAANYAPTTGKCTATGSW